MLLDMDHRPAAATPESIMTMDVALLCFCCCLLLSTGRKKNNHVNESESVLTSPETNSYMT